MPFSVISPRQIFGPIVLTLILVTATTLAVHAAEAAPAGGDTQPSEQRAENTEEPQQPTTDKSAARSEVFIPTEEISEDFAVSFPVDI
jgi:hypothetical protein